MRTWEWKTRRGQKYEKYDQNMPKYDFQEKE